MWLLPFRRMWTFNGQDERKFYLVQGVRGEICALGITVVLS